MRSRKWNSLKQTNTVSLCNRVSCLEIAIVQNCLIAQKKYGDGPFIIWLMILGHFWCSYSFYPSYSCRNIHSICGNPVNNHPEKRDQGIVHFSKKTTKMIILVRNRVHFIRNLQNQMMTLWNVWLLDYLLPVHTKGSLNQVRTKHETETWETWERILCFFC